MNVQPLGIVTLENNKRSSTILEKANIKDFKMWVCYFVVLPLGTKDLYSLTIMSLITICKGVRPDDLRFYKSLKSSINLDEALFNIKMKKNNPHCK